MDKILILFTMEGCPYCEMMKEQLDDIDADYVVRDINEHEEEYNMFVEITENDFVPAFMIVESPDENPNTMLFAPERDFNEIEEGVEIIKEHFKL
jgi:glutaredoxin